MGGEDVLVFRTEREAFSRYAKINRLRASLIKDVMDIYGFDLEDQYYSEGMNSGSSQFGQSLSQLTEVIPYDGKTRTHNGLEYEKGLTEEEINTAIETVFREN